MDGGVVLERSRCWMGLLGGAVFKLEGDLYYFAGAGCA